MFRAARGGVNVPDATYIGDIDDGDLLHLGGGRRSRWDVRDEVVSGPDVPRLHRDGRADPGALPGVREPEREGVAGEDRARERSDDAGALPHVGGLHAGADQGAVGQRHERCGDARCPDLPRGRDREVGVRDPRAAADAGRSAASGRFCPTTRSTCWFWTTSRRSSTGSAPAARSTRTCVRSGSIPSTTSTATSLPVTTSFPTQRRRRRRSTASRTRCSGRIYPEGAFLGIDSGVARTRDRA